MRLSLTYFILPALVAASTLGYAEGKLDRRDAKALEKDLQKISKSAKDPQVEAAAPSASKR